MTTFIDAMRRARHWLALGICLLATSASPVAQAEIRYYHTDALGSVAAISDEAGNIVEHRELDPYGLQSTPTLKDGPNFTGHVADAQTGLVQMQDRYFDPELGRFVSVDAVTPLRGGPQQFNRYAYANNNPATNVDPDGRSGFHFFASGIEPVLHARMAYDQYQAGRLSPVLAAQYFRGMGAVASDYLEEVRGVIRQDKAGLERERRNGVARAWADERRLVMAEGEGTRRWTSAQIEELISTGRISGFIGHHINSVNANPEIAGLGDNVKFVTLDEHRANHQGNWRNATSGPLLDRSIGLPGKIRKVIQSGTRMFRRTK